MRVRGIDSARPQSWSTWQVHLVALMLICVGILALFFDDFVDIFGIWWNSSTFNHCLLMVPMTGWLFALRIPQLRTMTPSSWWPGVVALGAAGMVWLVGDAAGVGLFRHLGIILMIQAAVVAVLGPHVARALLFPLAYMLLLIPFGEGLVPHLQTVTAKLSMVLLELSGISAHMEGIFITTPGGFFEVAEACSGIQFLIAMLAYAVFAAHLCFRGWRRRTIFVVLALLATIIANALRAYATIAVAQWRGVESAAGFDHIFYGWIFFGLVLVGVMLVARRWFDRPADDAAVDVSGLTAPARFAVPTALAAAIGLASLLVFSVWGAVSGQRAGALPERMTIATPDGWRSAPAVGTPWQPHFDGADRLTTQRYIGPTGRTVDIGIAAFARQDEGREVVGFGQGAVDPDTAWTWSSTLPSLIGAKVDRIFHPGPDLRDAAIWYYVDGQITGDERAAKLLGLKARLFGGDPRALALVVSSETGAGGRDAIAAFVMAGGGPKALADQSLKLR